MSLLDDVKARLNIVDVVSNYVPLTQAGRVFKARCPFHTERTPSFVVNPERGSWRCFGACAEGGDAIRFVMKMENQTFSEALRALAVRLGVPLPTPRQQAQMDPLLRANQEAMRFFQRRLQSDEGAGALAYLQDRGVAPETAEAFGLGLSPDGADELKVHLLGQGYTEEQLQRAGLVTRPQQGGSRDLFRGRLMFPIRDGDGRVVGFGGRELDGSVPKYLNTPQTPIFDKSALLWGLDAAKESIALKGEGVVVEGYMDALMAHQQGFTNVVASMGTALTDRQVSALSPLARRFVLALDMDAAGQDATMRSLKTSWANVPDVRIALLPEGKDPDELIRNAPERWPEVLEEAEPRVDFGFRLLAERFDLDTNDGRRALTEELGGWILSADEADQDRYMEKLEGLIGVNRQTLEQVLQRQRRAALDAAAGVAGRRAATRASPFDDPVEAPASAFERIDPLEAYPLALLMLDPTLREAAEGLRAEFFRRSENREVFQKWAECSTMEELKEDLDALLQEHLETLLSREIPVMDSKQRSQALAQSIRRLEERQLRELRTQLGASFSQAEAEGRDTATEEEELHRQDERFREIFSARVRRDI
ncbi:MAG: DNA primase [Chloroflexota bacterium]|nr:DNA primase [Chloroflexota bacterium]